MKADKFVKADHELTEQVRHGDVSLPVAVAQVDAKQGKPAKAVKTAKPANADDAANATARQIENDRLRAEATETAAFCEQQLVEFERTLNEAAELQNTVAAEEPLAECSDLVDG